MDRGFDAIRTIGSPYNLRAPVRDDLLRQCCQIGLKVANWATFKAFMRLNFKTCDLQLFVSRLLFLVWANFDFRVNCFF